MFISFNSIKTYFIINSTLLLITTLQYNFTHTLLNFLKYYISYNSIFYIIEFITTFYVLHIRNYTLLNIIDFNTKYKLNINIQQSYNDSQLIDFYKNVCKSTLVETCTFIFATKLIFTPTNILYDLLFFIPVSFIFEIIFDFFHYWTHRMVHINKFLYINFHKKHHLYIYPTSILAFYHDPFDLILTNSIPFLLTLYILSWIHLPISLFTLNMLFVYKTFIEISGHTGKKLHPSGSFPQFIWLPKLLGIQLYTENHDYHHTHTNCNFSKRFILWDKVFGTLK